MYSKVIIISGGSIQDEFAKEWIAEYQPDFIMVADSGMEFMRRVGLTPDMIIGDFDSVAADTLDFFKSKEGIIWKQLNPIKDGTDTEFAIRQAMELGSKEITVLGATGSRLDHVLGNISLLGIGLLQGTKIQLVDANNRIQMVNESLQMKKEEQFGSYVSLLPYNGEVEGLFLKGFKYPLTNFTLKPFNSLGISNEIVDDVAEIIFEKGVLLVIESRD